MQEPLVSVLMTSFNREKYIAQAIESVLASSYQNFELIIVDDCSKDNTVSIAEKFARKDTRVKVFINDKNLGDYPNRNKAASYASGKYIKYLDSDDFMYQHCLKVMVKCMESFPEAGFGLSAMPDKNAFYPACISPHDAYLEHFYGFGHFNRSPGSAIILRTVFNAIGGFTGKRMIGDNEMWFMLARKNYMVKMPRDLIWHRYHEGQESQSEYSKQYEILRRNVTNEALANSECPLSSKEITEIKFLLNKKGLKSLINKIYKAMK